MEQLIETIEIGFNELSNSIESLRFTGESSNNSGLNSILIILLICVLISINNNIKKLIEYKYPDLTVDKDKKMSNRNKLILTLITAIVLVIILEFVGIKVDMIYFIGYAMIIYFILKE